MDDVPFRIAVAAELLDVQHSIVVSISNAITLVERVKPVQYFPAIGDVVSVAVGGTSPRVPMSFDEFTVWKATNNCEEYDYRRMFSPGGTNPCEMVITPGPIRIQ